jgi:hypothetical protein
MEEGFPADLAGDSIHEVHVGGALPQLPAYLLANALRVELPIEGLGPESWCTSMVDLSWVLVSEVFP